MESPPVGVSEPLENLRERIKNKGTPLENLRETMKTIENPQGAASIPKFYQNSRSKNSVEVLVLSQSIGERMKFLRRTELMDFDMGETGPTLKSKEFTPHQTPNSLPLIEA